MFAGHPTTMHLMSEPGGQGSQPTGDAAGAAPGRSFDLPGERPPRRLLDRAPSERRAAPQGVGATPRRGSAFRALALGCAAAAAGVGVHLVAATLLAWTGGLLVVATTVGIVVGLAVAAGAGSSLRPRARAALGMALAVGSILVAMGLNWAASGMYLGPLEYADQVYGLIAPLQLALAALGALAGSR
jgi:hypothetical protein